MQGPTQTSTRMILPRDIDNTLQVINDCFFGSWCKANMRNYLRSRDSRAVVLDHIAHGIIGVTLFRYLPGRQCVFMDMLGVTHPHRREGFGTQLFERIRSRIKLHARNRIMTVVEESNLRGQQFLRHIGCRAVGETSEFDGARGEIGYIYFRHAIADTPCPQEYRDELSAGMESS